MHSYKVVDCRHQVLVGASDADLQKPDAHFSHPPFVGSHHGADLDEVQDGRLLAPPFPN